MTLWLQWLQARVVWGRPTDPHVCYQHRATGRGQIGGQGAGGSEQEAGGREAGAGRQGQVGVNRGKDGVRAGLE